MKYRLKKGDEIFETDLWVMADRKYASGWKFCPPEKEMQEPVKVGDLEKKVVKKKK